MTRANWRAGTARNKTVCVLIAVILIISTLSAPAILGFISRRKIVCDGYANVYQWILMYLDIESYSVFGKADDAGHAWN